jgi:methyl-accepting chemotaxis protein
VRKAWVMRVQEGIRSGTVLLSALACVTLLTCGVMMLILIRELDANAAQAEIAAVTASLDEAISAQRTSAYNTARWDDAVSHLYGKLDAQWAFANLSGTYRTYVIDEQGGTLFSRRADGRIDPPLRTSAAAATARLLRILPHDRVGAARLKQGIAMVDLYQGRPALFGAMAVTPLQGKVRVPSDTLRYLVYIDYIEAPLLKTWSARFGMGPIALSRTAGHSGISMPLQNAAGQPVGWLGWQPGRPGRKALVDSAPAVLAALAALGMIFALLVRILRSQERALVVRNEQQAALTNEAERLRAEAERSLDAAQRSRQAADEAARDAMREREQHAHELRDAAHEAGRSLQSTLAITLPDLAKLADRLDEGTDLVAASTRIQAQHAEDVVRRTSEAARSLEDIVFHTDRMAIASASIGGETAKTRAVVSSAAESSTAAGEANTSLLHHVTTISEATALIAGVAEQTNLLALNATIEAARSRAENAGFAVVAREIKVLSQDTQESAKLINQRVTSVQAAVHESVDLSRRIDAQLRQIHDHIATAADAAAQQAVASGDIRSSVTSAREQAVAVDTSMSQISGAITELARNAESSREISRGMRGRVQKLRDDLDIVIGELLSR